MTKKSDQIIAAILSSAASHKQGDAESAALEWTPPDKVESEISSVVLPIFAKDQDLRIHEEPIRRLTRAVKEGTATAEMASDVSKAASCTIAAIEPSFVAGKKVRAGSRKGHESEHGTPEEKAARYADYQKAMDQEHAAHPTWSHTKLSKHVATTFNVNPKTIQRHTSKPK